MIGDAMSNVPPHPEETHRLFAHDRVAVGYSLARPFLHREVFARVRERLAPGPPLRRALDVGCGTGMSSAALLDLAEGVVGLDPSLDMLRHARHAPGVRYVAALAEALPLRDGAFDLIVACGSIDWVDRAIFVPRAAELLVHGGWLVPLDFGDLGRSEEAPGLERWYDLVFQKAYPRPPARDPLVTPEQAAQAGFSEPDHQTFSSRCSFTASQYADFLMTESNVIAAIEYGAQTVAQVRGWLEAELAPLFAGASRNLTFGGYIQLLRKL
jgi:SAM-dependent methyltransferase